MSNHYHLCLETPEPNLSDGMRWLQSTFANRFNRYRKEHGHVFQGRYKAILLDEDAIGPVCHYIHLNPVQAGVVAAERLEQYEASSFHQLWHPRRRWKFCDYTSALDSAGELADKPKWRRLYRDYLSWLNETDGEKKRQGFESMCRGWAKGSKAFKKEAIKMLTQKELRGLAEKEARELRELNWEETLKSVLDLLGKTTEYLESDKKTAQWKVAMARFFSRRTLNPSPLVSCTSTHGKTNHRPKSRQQTPSNL